MDYNPQGKKSFYLIAKIWGIYFLLGIVSLMFDGKFLVMVVFVISIILFSGLGYYRAKLYKDRTGLPIPADISTQSDKEIYLAMIAYLIIIGCIIFGAINLYLRKILDLAQ